MNITTKLLRAFSLTALTMATMTINAGNIDANAARMAANSFIRQQAPSGMFKAPTASLALTHAEPSAAVAGAND